VAAEDEGDRGRPGQGHVHAAARGMPQVQAARERPGRLRVDLPHVYLSIFSCTPSSSPSGMSLTKGVAGYGTSPGGLITCHNQ